MELNMINQIELLEKLGIAAFGKTWKADLADSLPVARPTITDWINGKKPIPVGIWENIERILKARLMGLKGSLLEISEQKHLIVAQEMQRKHKATTQGIFADHLFCMSDDEIKTLYQAYKIEYARCSNLHPNDTFADLSAIKDALDFNFCVRNLDGNLDLKLAEDCALSFAKNKNLALSFGLDDAFLIERTNEILENVENG